ncbi:NeuD/PglB/VioB family sugar acetyltransferase [Psychrosphaera sp. B3R10]|uniref:NeuD/PglB/VioB family sugar acetyltransferase n=1 Tax=unclassified Psychrosphaera TaxID=2641570 RepID=UPI001C0A6732|nr:MULTISPECIES: NeuD/PglB/VioB family sugar acetyltransferase [unclassified Psychrosphaera]MBU2881830.1 NeuD/PglB/VioB family sugar acetyltransferase [Psychrosphaera sp. I2R16]MBU2989198.1 NeuD/PglB/VioB family sugar acetyltransferase [Psychrosphaera sp. B3R10]MDO6719986.1 NeuD/PglB/VioB family sugar acetyltransferase [Psychrosphaera sp. 1_MG-2023]
MSNLLLLGGGGHAATLAEILLDQGENIVGVVAPEITAGKKIFVEFQHFVNDTDVLNFDPLDTLLVNGIGSMPNSNLREGVYAKFKKLGYSFATIQAPSAVVSKFSEISEGAQILSNAVIGVDVKIGENTIINSSATVEHECFIGNNCHITPGVTLSGQVIMGDSVHIGTGSNLINNIKLGSNIVIGVGANITKSIESNSLVYGQRAKILQGEL